MGVRAAQDLANSLRGVIIDDCEFSQALIAGGHFRYSAVENRAHFSAPAKTLLLGVATKWNRQFTA